MLSVSARRTIEMLTVKWGSMDMVGVSLKRGNVNN